MVASHHQLVEDEVSTSRSSITPCGEHVRANVWTEHGASSKTCQTVSEARAWIAIAMNRKPVRAGA